MEHRPMKIISLGNTELKVSKMGLGLAALGRPGYINLDHNDSLGADKSVAAMEKHAHQVLDFAWDNGVRYFDTARSYGKAELFLASWLKSRSVEPSDITVSSKWGYVYTADWQVQADKHEIKYHTLENFKRQWVESKDILGNYINLYQIHSATLDSGVLDKAEIITALAKLKLDGILIGLSLSGTGQSDTLYKALEVEVDGVKLFDTVQLTWNILEKSTTEVLKDAKHQGLGVIVKEALANGRLYHFQQEGRLLASVMESVISTSQMTSDAVALAYVAQQSFIDTVLSGAATIAHLKSNLKFDRFELSADNMEALNAVGQPVTEYWETRSGMKWN